MTSRETITRPRDLCKSGGQLLQSLHLYGSFAIGALGWATARLLGFDSRPLVPLWFCGILAAYNLDRLKTDPADVINVPERTRRAASHRRLSLALIAGSVVYLLASPLLRGDWLLLLLVILGAVCAASYTLTVGARRLKDLPLLKTLAPPVVVTAAFLLPPLLAGNIFLTPTVLLGACWLLTLMLANMLICDRRDMAGDRVSGVRSIPVLIGEKPALYLSGVAILLHGLSAAGLALLDPAHQASWRLLALGVPAFALPVVFAARQPRPESFYEWLVEGFFLVPPALLCLAALW